MAKKSDVIRKAKENATKFIHKSAYDKALEQYRLLAKLEPNDLRHRIKIGECLTKLNKKKEAIAEYNEVVKEYTKEGFLIQAIAVARMILQLDPNETSAQNMIAELNAKRGIVTDKKPPVRPALSLAGYDKPIPSAVSPEVAKEQERLVQLPQEPPQQEVQELEEEVEEPPEMVETPITEEAPSEVAPSPSSPTPPTEEAHPAGTEQEPIPLEEAVEETSTQPVFPETPLFSDLGVEEFKRVVSKFQIGTLPKGITVIKEGTMGDSFFVIASGKVRVYKWSPNHKRKMTLAVLEEGSFFGEFAFLTKSVRSASVETIEECVLLRINRKDLEEIIAEFPNVREVMNEFYKKRVLDTLLKVSPLFQTLSDQDRMEVINKFENVELDTGDVIIREGEEGKALYVIKHGAIDVVKIHPETKEKLLLATLREGDFFGEISLLQNQPTTATCIAKVPTSLLRLPKPAFNELIMTHPQVLETVALTVDERLKSTAKSLTAKLADRQSEGMV